MFHCSTVWNQRSSRELSSHDAEVRQVLMSCDDEFQGAADGAVRTMAAPSPA